MPQNFENSVLFHHYTLLLNINHLGLLSVIIPTTKI